MELKYAECMKLKSIDSVLFAILFCIEVSHVSHVVWQER